MVYVTADLHGYPLEKFQKLLEKANFSEDDYLFILGDVIDRGADGVEILKWLLEQPNVELILGNHEAMLLACSFLFEEITEKSIRRLNINYMDSLRNWRLNGGEITIDALSRTKASVRSAIIDYLMDCPLYDTVSVGGRDFVLVHGGFGGYKEGKRLSDYTQNELVWTRPRTSERYSEEFITILGHTPTCIYADGQKGRIYKTDTWINIDTGAACGYAPALLRLDDLKEFYLE